MECPNCGGKMKMVDETVSVPGFGDAARAECQKCGYMAEMS